MAENKKSEETTGTRSKIPRALPVLPLRNSVFFPRQIIPLAVGREGSLKVVEEAVRDESEIVIVAQTDGAIEKPTEKDIHWVGTFARVLKVFSLPDGTKSVLVQGIRRAQLLTILHVDPFIKAVVRDPEETSASGIEVEAAVTNLKNLLSKAADLAPNLSEEQLPAVLNAQDPAVVTDMIAAMIPVDSSEKQQILECFNLTERLNLSTMVLTKFVQKLEIAGKIQSDVQDVINKSQREYVLREQMKAIRKELGEGDEGVELGEFRKKIEEAKLPEEPLKIANKELKRLSQMSPASAEYTVSRTYLEWILDLPWSTETEDNLDIQSASEVLERDHYGLERVKKRILEYLAVRKLKKDMRGPILAFVGPPGVGKTSLGRSIAAALGRKFVRISLGGVHDEAEIRGHRRTYIGALPGRIIQGLKKAGSANPVFMLDEVDKLGNDFRGDPSSALLEVLDPEQNFSFSDHYLEIPFDLSRVLFIATANMMEPIPPPLRDRMEIIEIPSYVEEEKLHIARRFLIPRQIADHGLKEPQLSIHEGAVRKIIAGYTREAGVRNLDRQIATVARGVAREVVEGEEGKHTVSEKNLTRYLGPQKFFPDVGERMNRPGVAIGLAWTPVGGDILFIEATQMEGKGGLILTGKLGETMKESAQAALSYIASNARTLGIEEKFRLKTDLHIHVPAGAIPKDGPSAGVTILTALASLLTGTMVRNDLAMTGEITLRGAVLPIGGVKEKVIAAHRAGIRTIILPERNRLDLEEIPGSVLKGDRAPKFHFVKEMSEVLEIALVSGNGVSGPPLRKKRAVRRSTD
ncbi:MAG: endopeptidase La [Ignavibacteria bacterium]|nr:endopeptidase La [Ignavibacteria bacterium]